MNEKLTRLYINAKKHFDLPDFDQFKIDMQDPVKMSALRENMLKHYEMPGLEQMYQDFGVKKKDLPVVSSSQKDVTEPVSTDAGSLVSPEKIKGISDYFERKDITKEKLDQDLNLQAAINSGVITDQDLINAGLKDPDTVSSINVLDERSRQESINKISSLRQKTKEEIDLAINQQKLNIPYKYKELASNDSFVDDVYGEAELALLQIDPEDFDGFLEEKGYKKDFIKKQNEGLFKRTYGSAQDPKLGYELEKMRLLNLYVAEQLNRDIDYQKLEKQKETGVDPDFTEDKFNFTPSKSNVNTNLLTSYIEKEMPYLTKKLKETEAENIKLYKDYKDGGIGAGTFMGTVVNEGWKGIESRIQGLSASFYGTLGKTGIDYFKNMAEATRMQMDQEKLLSVDNLSYVSISGKKVNVDGTNYLVDENNNIYDVDTKIKVDQFLNPDEGKNIIKKAYNEGIESRSFSTRGTAFQSANVIGDMVVQIALTGATGKALAAGAGYKGGIGALHKAKDILNKVPLSRSMSSAILAQSTLGASSGYNQTYQLAKDAGLNEDEARELASYGSVQMAALYAITAPISPQTKATEAIFGNLKSTTIKSAIEGYKKMGKKGFMEVFEKAGKKVVDLTGEGLKEVGQENVQQTGEALIVNRNINEEAGQKIAEDTITLDSFINTSILSFTAGMFMPGAGAAINTANRKARDIMGLKGIDRVKSLDYLARNEDKLKELLNDQVTKGVYTPQEVNDLLSEVNTYKEGIGKLPTDLDPEIALEVLDDIAEVTKLQNKKKTLDPTFHESIDNQIKEIRDNIKTKIDAIPEQETDVVPEAEQAEVVPEVEEEVQVSPEQEVETVQELLNRPVTLTELGGSKLETPIEGDMYLDGQQVVVEDANGNITEIGNVDEISDKTLEDMGIKQQMPEVTPTEDGNIEYQGKQYNPASANISLDSRGNVTKVVISEVGKARSKTFRGKNADDVVYNKFLIDATNLTDIEQKLEKDEEFQNELRKVKTTPKVKADEDTQESVEQTGVERLKGLFDRKQVGTERRNSLDQKIKIDEQVEKAKKSLGKLFPDITIDAYYNENEYYRARGKRDNSRGVFNSATNTISINLTNADKATVPHEVFHALLFNTLKSDPKIQKVVKDMVKAMKNTQDPGLIKFLSDEIQRLGYEENVQNEEIMSELFGALAGDYKNLKPNTQNIIKKFLDKLAKLLGLKPFTDTEIIGVLNTLAGRVAKGEAITEQDVELFKGGKVVDNPISALNKRSVGAFDVQYTEENKKQELIGRGLLAMPETVEDFSGQEAAITSPDDMLTGTISIDGKQIFEGGGGVFFVTKYGDVWASGNKSTADSLAKMINNSLNKNKGKGYLVLAKGSEQKLISSVSGVNSSLAILDVMLDRKLVSPSNFRSAISRAVKKEVFNISVKNQSKKYKKENNLKAEDKIPKKVINLIKDRAVKVSESSKGFIKLSSSSKELKKDINKYFSDPTTTTFETRGNVVKDIIGRLAQTNSVKENSKKIIELLGGNLNKGLAKGSTPKSQALGDLVAGVAAEKLTKGLSTGDIYAIIEVNDEVEVVKDSHPSYPYHVKIKNNKKPILHLLKTRDNGSKVFTLKSSKSFKVGNVSVMSGSFNESYIREQKGKGITANEIARKGFENDISEADMRQFAKENNISLEEMNIAIDNYKKEIAIAGAKAENMFTDKGVVFNFFDKLRRKFLSSRGFMPKSMHIGKEALNGMIEAESKQALNTLKDLQKFIKKYKGDEDAFIIELDNYLRGYSDIDVLPEGVQEIAYAMRTHIDHLSRQLVKSGAVSDTQFDELGKKSKDKLIKEYGSEENARAHFKTSKENILQNIGLYMTRSYEIFDNPDYSPSDEIIVAAKNKLREQYQEVAEELAAKNNNTVEAELQKLVDDKIKDILTVSGANDYLQGSKLGSKKTGILKQRINIPSEIRALMGEYTDPALNYARSIQKISALVANQKFLNKMKKAGEGVFFFKERTDEFNTQIASEGSDTMNPLNGMFTTPEIAEAMTNSPLVSISSPLSPLYNLWLTSVGGVKFSKTILSPATHAKNIIGNLFFMAYNGYTNPKDYFNSLKVVYNDLAGLSNKELRSKLDEYIRAGIINQSATLGEIKSLFRQKDNIEDILIKRMNDPKLSLVSKFKKHIKKSADFAQDLYQAEDDFFKIVSYENEKRRYAKAFFNKDFNSLNNTEKKEVLDYITEITKNILPNYSRIGELGKFMKAFPVAGTFISFQIESMRTAYNTIDIAFNELKDPKTRSIGLKRLTGIMSIIGVKAAILGTFGMTEDEEEEASRIFLPPWAKNANIYISEMKDGKFKYINFSASDPHGFLDKALIGYLKGEDTFESMTSVLDEIVGPFYQKDILFNALTNITANENDYGREIFNETDTPNEVTEKILSRLWKVFEPGAVTSARKVLGSDTPLNEIKGQLTGFKEWEVDLKDQVLYKSIDIKARSSEAGKDYRKALTEFKKRKINREELEERYQKANQRYKQVIEEGIELYNSALKLGLSKKYIILEMKGKFSQYEIANIVRGKVPEKRR